MSHYHARSLVGSNRRIFTRRTGSGFDRQTIITESLKGMEVDGEPLLDADGLKGLVRLLRLAQVTVALHNSLIVTIYFCH